MPNLKSRIEALEKKLLPADDVDVDGFWNHLISLHASVPVQEEKMTFEEAEQFFIEHRGITKAEFAKQFKRPGKVSVRRNV